MATRALVEEKGPDTFSVSEASRAAGVSSAAPYRHFKDKRELLVAVAMDGMARMRDQMKGALPAHPPGSRESVTALGQVYVDFAQAEPGVFRLMFGLTEAHDESDEMLELGRATYGVLLEEVCKYLHKTELDAQVQATGFSLWTMVHGMSFLLIDQKVDVVKLTLDIPQLLSDNTARLLGQRPAAAP
ncbi:MAG: TetR/AcrR family transcriptional regulator [Pseudomonadota bacterium]